MLPYVNAAGDTNGDNLNVNGGPWYVVKQPFYSVLVMARKLKGPPPIWVSYSSSSLPLAL